MARLLHDLGGFEGKAFEASPLKAHAADCLRTCIGSLSVVDLLELLPHLDGPAFDEMEDALWMRLPREFERMFGATASPLNLWIKTSKALAKYALIAEKKGRPLGIGFSLNFMTQALESLCKESNTFDAVTLLGAITESARIVKAHMGAAKTLLNQLPSNWEKLLRSSAEDSKIKEGSPELKANLIAILARLALSHKRPAPIAHALANCERKMWALAFKHFASDELSEIIKGAGELDGDSEGRVGWRPSFDVSELLAERRASIKALDNAGGSGKTGDAAELFVDSFRLAILLLGDDARFGSSLGLYPLAVQDVSAKGYGALTGKTRQEILQRLTEAEVVTLRNWIESLEHGILDKSDRDRDSALKQIDKFLKKK